MNLHHFFLGVLTCLRFIAAFSPFDSPEFCSQIITPSCNTTFSYIDALNAELRPDLIKLTETEYFKYFKLDLDKQCKFWNAQHFCATENCAVEILSPQQYNWSNIQNEDFKPSKLGKLAMKTGSLLPDTCEDLDYCHIDDDHHCVYVNLLDNPERFTGYGGAQSFEVWKAIYSENCFPNTNPMSMISDKEEKCVEKNLFYRLVSGMHASIAVHLSNEYLDSDTNTFYPNLKVFMERVGGHNDRLSNIYFNFALVSQSLVKLNKMLDLNLFIDSGLENIQVDLIDQNHNNFENSVLNKILAPLESNTLFDTSNLFNPQTTPPDLKDEFRARFKNISAIMDCVGCDRCRMWGKLQTIGYGTALKILFENDVDELKFRRIEIVALINTFDRLSKSIDVINNFKIMYSDHLNQVKYGLPTNQGFNFPFYESKTDLKPIETKVPQKLALEPKELEITLKLQFKATLYEIGQALKFIGSAYYRFPQTLAKLAIIRINVWWIKFLGNPKHQYYDPVVLSDDQRYFELMD